MDSAEPTARTGACLPEGVARALGVPEGTRLETRPEFEAPSPVTLIRPDGSSRVFLAVEISREGSASRGLALLRILPLDLGSAPAESGAARPARWRQEWADLTALSRPEAGIPTLFTGGIRPPRHAPMLPPLFFCRVRHVWIAAVCPGCRGAVEGDHGAGERCPSCGSPASAGSLSRPEGTPSLRALWERVQGGATGDGLDPACVSCDRRAGCFPVSGPSEEPGTAGDVLQPISRVAWGGALLEPFHLPFTSWCALAAGAPWVTVREGLPSFPPAILEDLDARMLHERAFLQVASAPGPFGLESLLLRLETLRQLLEGVRMVSLGLAHPHLGLAPETVWVRIERPGSLRTALWSARLVFLDPAPAGGGDRVAGRPPFLVPPGCEVGDEWFEGMCIPRAAGTASAETGQIGIDFLPNAPLAKPPVRGDAVRLGVPSARSGVTGRVFAGTVEIGFPEVCRILVSDPALSPEEIRGVLTGAAVKLQLKRDHSLVDDLYAAGTMFLSLLLREAGDLEEAARFRDALAPRLRGAGGSDGGMTESLRAVESSGVFAVQGGSNPLESASGEKGVGAVLDRALVARAVALGMRMCAAIPGGYPCQAHEPAGPAEKERAYDGLLDALTALSREVRERLFATAVTDDAALAALGTYVVEWLQPAASHPSDGAKPPGGGSRRETR